MIAAAAESRKIEFLVVVDILYWDHIGHLEKYPFRAACKSDSKNLFEFDHWERVRWGNWVSLI